MTVCKFFLEGRCSYGSNCRFEHPGDSQQRNNHRFGATDSNNPLRGRIGFPGSSTDYNSTNKIFDDRSVRADLSKDRPEYKYSCYGPAKEEPNLLEGTDFSAEELRVQYYTIMNTNGVDAAYRAGVKDLEDRMQGQIDTILRDVRSALSRFDTKRQQLAQQQATGGFAAFGQQQPPQPQPEPQQQGAYGTPSVLGAPAPSITPSPFGSSTNQTNTPSLLGSSYNQPTATPSLFGSAPSAFGASTFGGTGSLGYPGVQAQPNTGSIFGGGFQPQPQQPDPQQQQYLLQMQQQELYAQQQQQQQQQQQMLQQQMLQQQQMQQQQQQPGNTQGTINNPQIQAFASSEFQLYQIPEIPPPPEFRR